MLGFVPHPSYSLKYGDIMLNLDRLIVEFDKGLRTLFSQAHSVRPHPDAKLPEATMDEAGKNMLPR